MVITIQCQGKKSPNAQTLLNSEGKIVNFVAQPQLAPWDNGCIPAHPDDASDSSGKSWREVVNDLNNCKNLTSSLSPAFLLYGNPAYKKLVNRFGVSKLRIFSAGWGVVRADFLLPSYNITFKNPKPNQLYIRRLGTSRFDDYLQLCEEDGTLVFLGGKDYATRFKELTKGLKNRKVYFYRADPKASSKSFLDDGILHVPFLTKCSTNWQFSCASWLCEKPEILREFE